MGSARSGDDPFGTGTVETLGGVADGLGKSSTLQGSVASKASFPCS